MNELTNITLNNATLDFPQLQNGGWSNGMMTECDMVSGSITMGDYNYLNIKDTTIITIEGESFSGSDLKDLLKMTKTLKLQNSSCFI